MKKVFSITAGLLVLVGLLLLLLPTILHRAGLHPDYSGPSVDLPGKRALVITTSHSVLAAPGEADGKATGVFGSEMTHPYYTFLDGGMEVDIASIQGGELPIDPSSFYFMVKTPEDDRYLNDPVAQAKVKNSIPIAEADIGQWRLFNIITDPGETKNLARSHATTFQGMLSRYGRYQRDHGVLAPPVGYRPLHQVLINALSAQYGESILIFLLTVLVLTPFYVAYRLKQRGR